MYNKCVVFASIALYSITEIDVACVANSDGEVTVGAWEKWMIQKTEELKKLQEQKRKLEKIKKEQEKQRQLEQKEKELKAERRRQVCSGSTATET